MPSATARRRTTLHAVGVGDSTEHSVNKNDNVQKSSCDCSVPCYHWYVARFSGDRAFRLPAGVALLGSLGQLRLPSLHGVGKSSTSLARVKAGHVHLCRVAGNTVIRYGTQCPVAQGRIFSRALFSDVTIKSKSRLFIIIVSNRNRDFE